MKAFIEMGVDELRAEIARMLTEYSGKQELALELEYKPLPALFNLATAYAEMLRLKARAVEFAGDALRAEIYKGSASDIRLAGNHAREQAQHDGLVEQIAARFAADYRGHQISYRNGFFYIDSLAGHLDSLIEAMKTVDVIVLSAKR